MIIHEQTLELVQIIENISSKRVAGLLQQYLAELMVVHFGVGSNELFELAGCPTGEAMPNTYLSPSMV